MELSDIRDHVASIQADTRPKEPSEHEYLSWQLMDLLSQTLKDRNGRHGMPIGNFTLAPPVVGATTDPDMASMLESNQRDQYTYTGMDLHVRVEDDEDVLKHRRYAPYQDEEVVTVRTHGPRWRTDGDYAEAETCWHDGQIIETTVRRVPAPVVSRLHLLMATTQLRHQSTLAASERIARAKLDTLLSPEQRDWYEVDGSLFEKSSRSGIHYLLRKSRPILALRIDEDGRRIRPLCALCIHPFAYYHGTWASVFPPSDEVMMQLLLIRGDERGLWAKANHLPIDHQNSGI